MYAAKGRPSVPPEQLLKATVLMAMYSIRSERAFCERLNYDLLFKWFLDLRDRRAGVRRDDVLEEPPTAPGPRDRGPVLRRGGRPGEAAPLRLQRPLLRGRHPAGGVGVAQELQTQRRPAGRTPPPGRNAEVDFHGEKRSNGPTRRRPIPRRAWPARATPPRRSCVHGASADGAPQRPDRGHGADRGDGYAERDAALEMLGRLPATERRRTVAGDKGYDTARLRRRARQRGFTPHVAQNTTRQRQRHRWAHHPPPRPRHQPTDPETDRGTLRLDQDHRRRPQTPLHRPSTATEPGSSSPAPSTTSSASPTSTPHRPDQPQRPAPPSPKATGTGSAPANTNNPTGSTKHSGAEFQHPANAARLRRRFRTVNRRERSERGR